jgi:hypothetical protein
MRAIGAVLGPILVVAATLALGCEELGQALGADAGADAAPAPSTGADAGAVVGGGCGFESNTGAQLCAATSKCPDVVVDTQAMPSCGFRVRGVAVDLVCACGTALCPMGVFATCEEAKQLLASQTEQGVCVQLAEGRCIDTATTSSSSSGSPSGGSNPACDPQCVRDCGGGAACASVCNCD